MSVIVFTVPLISPKQTHAIGFIGSNAVKSAVINSMESVGVKFANKDAKEKAFQAWNMKAYEKWQADEAAGRNADLWEHFNSVQSQIASAPVENIPDKPNFGKMLLDATWFGMAIAIGAEVGFAIEDAQIQNKAIKNLVSSYQGLEGDYSLNNTFGFTNNIYAVNPNQTGGYRMYNEFNSPTGSRLANASSVLEGEVLPAYVYAVEPFNNYGTPSFMFYFRFYQRPPSTGKITEYERTTSVAASKVPVETIDGAFPVEWYPKPEHVPSILPNPHVEPLIAPQPDISVVPGIIPQKEPVPMIVPLNDPFEDNPYIEPFTPVEPVKPPVKPPVTTPGQDPNKKPIPEVVPEPGTIKDPLEQPKEVKPENLSCERVQRPDFEPLGNAFTTSFPFSLPWDLKRYLDASFSGIGSEKPKFPLPFFGDEVEITIPDELDKYVGFFKGFLLIVFDIGIIYLFVRVMRGGSD